MRGDRFFLYMFLMMAVVLVYGFRFTVEENLFHPVYPRPGILYVHAVVSALWIPLVILQSGFIAAHQVDLHRRLGMWGMVHGALIGTMGLATAVAMAKVRLAHGEPGAADSFPIPVNDAIAFTCAFALGVFWRKRPDYHKRLMFLASCVLTAPGFGRIPALDHAEWFYCGVDALIAIAVLRDLIVVGSVHAVLRFGFPLIVLAQLATAYIRWTPQWLTLAPKMFG